jgi:hypothetical protein
MAWETRGRTRYFYRSQRVGNAVRKVYIGSGNVAKQAAEKDTAAKAKRAAQEVELAELQATLAGLDQTAAEVETGVELLTEAALLSMGFHQHRGQWREHRNGDRTGRE